MSQFVTYGSVIFILSFAYCVYQNFVRFSPFKFVQYKENALINSQCTICIEDFVEKEKLMMIRQCKHIFHPLCLQQWNKYKDTCPNCQIQIDF